MLLSLFYLGLIAMLSLLPSKDLPELHPFAAFDKVVHACMYFGLTILSCWTLYAEERRIRIVFIVLFASCWGLLMEFSQLEMMMGRAFEWTDELSNGLGALLGAVVYAWIAGYYRKRGRLGEGARGRGG
jgi:VanZ family protein